MQYTNQTYESFATVVKTTIEKYNFLCESALVERRRSEGENVDNFAVFQHFMTGSDVGERGGCGLKDLPTLLFAPKICMQIRKPVT